MIIPLGQNCLIERDKERTENVISKTGVVLPNGQIENEGLVFGTVLQVPEDQNLLVDKTRPINSIRIGSGDRVWYSKYSTAVMLDDRDGKQGELLDIVPLEDLRAVVR